MLRALIAGLVLAVAGAGTPPMAVSRQIRVPVWMEDGDSGTLAATDFDARVDGLAARVVAVQGPADDLIVLTVLDLTGDLAYAGPAKDALANALRQLPAHAWAGLLRAQDGLRVLVDPTPDRESVIRAAAEVPVSGMAGFLNTVETVETIADAMLAKSSVRVAVLYLTDSDVRNYREDLINPVINSSDPHDLSRRFPEVLVQERISKLAASLAADQAPLFIVHLHYRTDRLNEAYQNGLKQLAEVTGGTAAFCRSEAEIPDVVRRSLETIASYYSVTLALPQRAPHSLEVRLERTDGPSPRYRSRFVLKRR